MGNFTPLPAVPPSTMTLHTDHEGPEKTADPGPSSKSDDTPDELSALLSQHHAEEAQTEVPRAFLLAGRLADLDAGKGRMVLRTPLDEIAIFRVGGELHAVSNVCPHEQAPLLVAGDIDEAACSVTCPMHGWTFDLRSGRQIGATGRVRCYELRIEGEELWVEEPVCER